MTVRDERAAVLRRWNRDLGDNFTAVLPRVLDDLEAIDREYALDPAVILPPGPLAWVQAHPEDLEALLGMGPLSAGDIAAARKKLAALPYGPEQAELVARLEEEHKDEAWGAANPAVPARVKPPAAATARTATARTTTRRRTRS